MEGLTKDEYIAWLEPKLKAEDQKFRKLAMTETAKHSKPIRTAEGRNQARHMTRDWMWGDAIWCGDIHMEHISEFLEIDDEDKEAVFDELLEQQWFSNFIEEVWNDVFERLVPDMYWRHIATELGRKPTNDIQKYWMEHGR